MARLKILVSCANGAGTSMMMKMRTEKAVKDLGLRVEKIHHCSISEGKSQATQYDIVLCPLNFVDMFSDAAKKGVSIIGIKNVLSDKEIGQKLTEAGFVAE